MSIVLISVLAAFAGSVVFALILTPLVIRFAVRVGAVDAPNERKTHAAPMPRMGGVAVLASAVLSLILLRLINPGLESAIWVWDRETAVIGVALLLMLSLGIWDDIKTLGPGLKFFVQLAIASLVYAGGFSITIISFPNPEGYLQLDILRYLVTTAWIIGVTNAVNLIDGLDGLASGVAMIACLTIAPVAYMNSDFSTAVLALLLAGGLLGFLRYNFNPAKIFLGDSGSLVLGFSLAVLSIRSSTKASTAFAILVPILALGLPIMETFLSMLRRLLKSLLHRESAGTPFASKLKTMFLPDKSHIHHRLMAFGLSHRNSVLVLYVVSCALGAGAFALSVVNNVTSALILVVVGCAAFMGVRRLRYTEMAVLKNGILLPLYDRDFINRETFQGFLDVFFIGLSFTLAQQMAHWGGLDHLQPRETVIVLALVCLIQSTVLLLSGLYKESIRHVGLGEVVRTTKDVALAVIVTGVIFEFVITPTFQVTIGTIVLDFYLLVSFVLGSRISFRVLKNLSQSASGEGKRVLLYGAGMNGRHVLEKVRSGKLRGLVPVGFLDDDTFLEGKRIHGLMVFGGHWKLQRLLNRMNIDEVLMATNSIKPEILRRVEIATRSRGVRVRKLSVTLEEMIAGEPARAFADSPYKEQPARVLTSENA